MVQINSLENPDTSREESVRRDAIEEEQHFLDVAVAQRDRVAERLEAEIAAPTTDPTGLVRQRTLRRQYEDIQRTRDGLVFGRLDGMDGTVLRVGRIGIRDEDENADPLVVDWRAPAARPFYTATPVDPQGQARRRHLRTGGSTVLGVDDEPLDGSAAATGLVGEGALLAALDSRRTGKMSTAISTLQREQDDIIRAEASGPLIVQGGPGTGKTVVALHRVAYLLFTHQQMAEKAVLVLGPSTRFLDYIAQVLPALGETAVVAATCDTLLPGIVAQRAERRDVAEIKGRGVWRDALGVYVQDRLPPARGLKLRWEGDDYLIEAPVVAQLLASAIPGRSYHRARATFAEQLHQTLAKAVAEHRAALLDEMEEGIEDLLAAFDRRTRRDSAQNREPSRSDVDGLMSEDEIEELRERIAGNAAIARFIETWWPTLDPAAALHELLGDRDRLRHYMPALTAGEAALIAAEPQPWASSDIPLLDTVADLLGEPTAPQPQGEFVADRARSDRSWAYGHVVIDEAQELSDMQWHMVLRRCPTRSITGVGDIDQAEAAHRHTSWADAVRSVFGDRWTAAELTICYRTPREVMELTGPVLREAGSRNNPPQAVRSSGISPWTRTAAEEELAGSTARAVAELQERWVGGTVGVVAPAARVAGLAAAVSDVPVLSATQAKGLEWDATLIVDPDDIIAEPRGWNRFYVALTRCTQELGRLVVV